MVSAVTYVVLSLAEQSVTVDGHEVTVCVRVLRIVDVVKPIDPEVIEIGIDTVPVGSLALDCWSRLVGCSPDVVVGGRRERQGREEESPDSRLMLDEGVTAEADWLKTEAEILIGEEDGVIVEKPEDVNETTAEELVDVANNITEEEKLEVVDKAAIEELLANVDVDEIAAEEGEEEELDEHSQGPTPHYSRPHINPSDSVTIANNQ